MFLWEMLELLKYVFVVDDVVQLNDQQVSPPLYGASQTLTGAVPVNENATADKDPVCVGFVL
jgi:hypothetical protein